VGQEMKRELEIGEELPTFTLPLEVFDIIVGNMYALVDVCHWYTCQKSTTSRWKLGHIESLLIPMYERNVHMFEKTKHSYYIKNAAWVNYTQSAAQIIPKMIGTLGPLDIFLLPQCNVNKIFAFGAHTMIEFFKEESKPVERDGKTFIPFSFKQEHVYSIIYLYIRNNHGFLVFLHGSDNIWYGLASPIIFTKVTINSEFGFGMHPNVPHVINQ
jgi:hypothetical protein